MIADELIRQCHEAGIELSINGDSLHYKGNGAFIRSIEKELRDNKAAILETLAENDLIQFIVDPAIEKSSLVTIGQRIDAYMTPCLPLRDDKHFLIMRLPSDIERCRAVLRAYKQQWLVGMEQEPLIHKKQNKGRYKANTWLRCKAGYLINTH